MSTTKRYGVVQVTDAPIEFILTDDRGNDVGTFHVARKQRLDLIQAMARAVTLDKGFRVYDINILTFVIRELLIKERFDEPNQRWVPADDVQRFDAIVASDRITIPVNVLGELAMDLMKETTEHPTGGSGPSWAGPTSTPPTSKGDSDSLVLP